MPKGITNTTRGPQGTDTKIEAPKPDIGANSAAEDPESHNDNEVMYQEYVHGVTIQAIADKFKVEPSIVLAVIKEKEDARK